MDTVIIVTVVCARCSADVNGNASESISRVRAQGERARIRAHISHLLSARKGGGGASSRSTRRSLPTLAVRLLFPACACVVDSSLAPPQTHRKSPLQDRATMNPTTTTLRQRPRSEEQRGGEQTQGRKKQSRRRPTNPQKPKHKLLKLRSICPRRRRRRRHRR